MGKTFSTGLLTNGIWQDASNNIGIGGSPSGSYKFEVTGAGNFTGALRASGLTLTTAGSTSAVISGTGTNVYSSLSLTNTTTGYGYDIGFGGSASIAPNSFYIYGGSSASVKFLINSSGNVGIGTSSPQQKLHVEGDVYLANNRNLYFANTGVAAGAIRFFNATSGTTKSAIGSYYNVADEGNLEFLTGSGLSTRMLITSGGQTQILCPTSSIAALIVRNSASTVPAGQDILFTASPNNTTSAFLYCADGTEGKFVVWSNGDVDSRTNSYGGWSDIKLKENISDATPKLNDLLKVKVKNYNFIGDDKKQLGVIAQELEEIFPALISETPDYEIDEETGEKLYLDTTTKSVKYSVFVPMLIKAIQEQQTQIELLSNKIVALESK
jgi:hypothetical protein